MISNLNGLVRVHQTKAVFTGSRFRFGFDSLLVSDSLNFEKQKECYASQHMSRDFY